MIVTVYTPDGIVISTLDNDSYYHCVKRSGEDYIEKLNIAGHPHTIQFWNRYALVFHQVDEYQYNDKLKPLLEEVMNNWPDAVPPIYEFMPYIKKQILDNELDLIGVMGGYSRSQNGTFDPYVYQILGSDIRRININHTGDITYNCVFLEKETVFGRILRGVKIQNGDNWEELPPLNIRCDLFSINKALKLSRFILNTSQQLAEINSSEAREYEIESIIVTRDNLNNV